MSGIEHDLPDLGVTINNDLQTTRVIVRQQAYVINQNSIPIPDGIVINAVSSSYAQTASRADLAVTASFALSNAGTVQSAVSASYAVTASYVSGAASTWNDISNKPDGLVSSSTQINTGSFSGSFIGDGSGLTNIASTLTFSGSTGGDVLNLKTETLNILGSNGITTSITDNTVTVNLPTGAVSASAQINTGSFSGSFTGQLIGTSSWAQNAITASAATSLTFATFSNTSFLFPQNVTIGGTLTAQEFYTEMVSSSIIYESGSTKFGDSLDDTHSFTGSLRVNGGITSSLFGTSSYAISSSYAETSSVTLKVRILSGSVGSGAAVYTGSFSGSFYGDGSNLAGVNSITISGSAPIPKTGSLWYDNTTGKTYIYYVSASQGQWVLQSDPTYDIGAVVEAATASVALTIPNTAPATPLTGSIYFSGAWLYVYNGVKYVSASLN